MMTHENLVQLNEVVKQLFTSLKEANEQSLRTSEECRKVAATIHPELATPMLLARMNNCLQQTAEVLSSSLENTQDKMARVENMLEAAIELSELDEPSANHK